MSAPYLTGLSGRVTCRLPRTTWLMLLHSSDTFPAINACRSPIGTRFVRMCQSRSQVATASAQLKTTSRVLLVRVNAPRRAYEVDRHARVDRRGDPAAHTAGPTRPPQRWSTWPGSHHQPAATALEVAGTRWGRAVDTSRPGASVMRRAVSSAASYFRPSRTSPSLDS